MYYGFRCYTKTGKPLGWLYTARQEEEFNWTDKPSQFGWCKRWKTRKGAEKNFDYYQHRWQFLRQQRGGYLKIEVMPEVPEIEAVINRTSQQKWDAKNSSIIKESKTKYDQNNPVWSFRLTSELQEWLEAERWNTNKGKPESNAQLITRKLEKLRTLESQGY